MLRGYRGSLSSPKHNSGACLGWKAQHPSNVSAASPVPSKPVCGKQCWHPEKQRRTGIRRDSVQAQEGASSTGTGERHRTKRPEPSSQPSLCSRAAAGALKSLSQKTYSSEGAQAWNCEPSGAGGEDSKPRGDASQYNGAQAALTALGMCPCPPAGGPRDPSQARQPLSNWDVGGGGLGGGLQKTAEDTPLGSVSFVCSETWNCNKP